MTSDFSTPNLHQQHQLPWTVDLYFLIPNSPGLRRVSRFEDSAASKINVSQHGFSNNACSEVAESLKQETLRGRSMVSAQMTSQRPIFISNTKLPWTVDCRGCVKTKMKPSRFAYMQTLSGRYPNKRGADFSFYTTSVDRGLYFLMPDAQCLSTVPSKALRLPFSGCVRKLTSDDSPDLRWFR